MNFEILVNYGMGWEVADSGLSKKEARDRLELFKEDEPEANFKIVQSKSKE